MRYLPEFLRPSSIYEPRDSEMAAAKTLPAEKPFLPANIDVTFFYLEHGTKKDFKPVAALLPEADIFIPELIAWNVNQVAYFSRISQGDTKARKEWEHEEGFIGPFSNAELKAIWGTKLRITLIDYPASDTRAEESQSHWDNWSLLDKVVPSWHQTLDNIIHFANTEADLEDYRENLILRSIGPRLSTLITEDPELSQKERIKVVLSEGEAHSFFYPRFEELAVQAESVTIRALFRDGHTDPHFDRLVRTFREDTEITQQQRRELAMKSLARVGLRFHSIPLVIRDSDHRGLRLVLPPAEEMVERFGVDDIKRFHQRLVESKGQKART